MPEQESIQSLEEEIHALEEKLAARKISEAGSEEREEKEVFRDILREHVESAKEQAEKQPGQPGGAQGSLPPSTPYDYAAQIKSKPRDTEEQEHREQVEALVEIALSKGILEAVRVARHLGNPHLLDDFHDMLVDEYYEKLLQARHIT